LDDIRNLASSTTARPPGAAPRYDIDTIRQKLYEKTPSAVNKFVVASVNRSRNGRRRPTKESMA